MELIEPGAAEAGLVGDLLDQIHAYYDLDPLTPEQRADVVAQLLGRGHNDLVLARDLRGPLGLAVYSFVYPADGPRPGLFLHELFVSQAARGRGVGRALMARLVAIAQARDCARIDWAAEATNAPAMTFYAQIGAERVAEKRYFRVEAKRFAAFAEGLD